VYDLLVVGDITLNTHAFPRRNHITAEHIGGSVTCVAVSAAQISDKVGIFAAAGEDCSQEYFKQLGIDTKGFKNFPGKTTRIKLTYLSDDGNIRDFAIVPNPNVKIEIEKFPKEYLDSKFIHLSANPLDMQYEYLKFLRKHTNATISVDTFEAYYYNDPQGALRNFDMADIAFIDAEFQNAIRDTKAPLKIIKHGGVQGCTFQSQEKKMHIQAPTIPEVVDKSGAGDCVCGTFLILLSKTKDIEFSLRKANEIATASITKYGIENISYDFEILHKEIEKFGIN